MTAITETTRVTVELTFEVQYQHHEHLHGRREAGTGLALEPDVPEHCEVLNALHIPTLPGVAEPVTLTHGMLEAVTAAVEEEVIG